MYGIKDQKKKHAGDKHCCVTTKKVYKFIPDMFNHKTITYEKDLCIAIAIIGDGCFCAG